MGSTGMSNKSSIEGAPTYLGGGDTGRFGDYDAAWVDNLFLASES